MHADSVNVRDDADTHLLVIAGADYREQQLDYQRMEEAYWTAVSCDIARCIVHIAGVLDIFSRR